MKLLHVLYQTISSIYGMNNCESNHIILQSIIHQCEWDIAPNNHILRRLRLGDIFIIVTVTTTILIVIYQYVVRYSTQYKVIINDTKNKIQSNDGYMIQQYCDDQSKMDTKLSMTSNIVGDKNISSSSSSSFMNYHDQHYHDNNNNNNNHHHHHANYQNNKSDFLHRVNGLDDTTVPQYGYTCTPVGFIDHWRSKELPTLIEPIIITMGDDLDDNPTTAIDERKNDNTNTNKNNRHNNSIINTNHREVYLDYAGAALPTLRQMQKIISLTTNQILGNPHSVGPAASRTKQFIKQVTERILHHFHAQSGKYYGHHDHDHHHHHHHTTTNDDDTTDRNLVDDHPGYEIIFTSGTTHAIQIIAEHFPWRGYTGSQRELVIKQLSPPPLFVYAQNSHNSVVGIREVALQQNPSTRIVCQPVDQLIQTILQCTTNSQHLEDEFQKSAIPTNVPTSTHNERCDTATHVPIDNGCRNCVKHLFAVPMECNFSGDRHDVRLAFQTLNDLNSSNNNNNNNDHVSLCNICQQQDHHQSWYTMLDIAKAASTSPINLCELNPDFACVSFYKMFGEPTGLGCLFVKRTAIDVLHPFSTTTSTNHNVNNNHVSLSSYSNNQRHYVGGGAVDVVVPGKDYTVYRSEPTPLESFRSGTPHFRGIIALLAGFNELDQVGGMERIRQHTHCLTQELVRRLQFLQHRNGRQAVILYGNWKQVQSDSSRGIGKHSGPVVALNVLRSDGSYVGYNEVSKLAALYRPPIQLRTGCFCNPGACQIALDLSDEDVICNFKESGHVCGDPIDIINNHPTGVIRVSFGKDSIWEDMDTFATFIEQLFVNSEITDHTTASDSSRNERIPTTAVITELYIFPIKSCAAQRVTDWPMDPSSGRLHFDREFALVDSSGSAMRLQMYPKLALLRPIIDLETLTLTVHGPDQVLSSLILHLDDQSARHTFDRKRSIVKVCGNKCSGYLWGNHDVSEWFSRYLGVRCWLARHLGKLIEFPATASTVIPLPTDSYRPLSFANEQPILLISEHAIDILNDVMRQSRKTSGTQPLSHISVCAQQFRPNIVVRQVGKATTTNQVHPQIEDSWSRISILDRKRQTSVTLDVVGPCARCAMVDIDPMTGSKVDTLRALATYRRRGNAHITFGIFIQASLITESLFPEKNVSKWHRIGEGNLLLCEEKITNLE